MVRRSIPVSEPQLDGNELSYVADCIKSGWISSLGSYVTRFEQEFAAYCDCKQGVATANGTVALHLALAALGVGPGDEVLVPALTFVSTANAVAYTGARPVFLDSEPETGNLDPTQIESRIGPRTRGIVVVHLYGHPADMDPILRIARRRGLFVVEDAAEAHGALYRGRRTGSIGDVGCFSFYGNKVITTGEGGMLTTNDAALAARARTLRDQAMSPQRPYWHDQLAFNYRMTNLQGAVGVAQLERIEEFLAMKRLQAGWYNSRLSGLAGVTLPVEKPWAHSIYWMYSILIEESFGPRRDEVIAGLRAGGVDTRPYFVSLPQLPMYTGADPCPVADELSRKGINLPSSVKLTEEDVAYVCETLRGLRA